MNSALAVDHVPSPDPFVHAVSAYSLSMLRLYRAKYIQAELKLAVASATLLAAEGRCKAATGPMDSPEHLCGELASVEPKAIDAHRYVVDVSLFVYATALFDTFLQDTLEYLCLRFPGTLSDLTIGIADLVAASDLPSLITTTVQARVKQLGLLTFSDRVKLLRKRFKLSISIPAEAVTALAHYSDVRNTIVHDQGFFDFTLSASRDVAVVQKACPMHPTLIRPEDFEGAIRAQTLAAKGIAEAVLRQVVKLPPDSELFNTLDRLSHVRATVSGSSTTESPAERTAAQNPPKA